MDDGQGPIVEFDPTAPGLFEIGKGIAKLEDAQCYDIPEVLNVVARLHELEPESTVAMNLIGKGIMMLEEAGYNVPWHLRFIAGYLRRFHAEVEEPHPIPEDVGENVIRVDFKKKKRVDA